MKRLIRGQRLTAEEASRYRTIREQVSAELPELVHRQAERSANQEEAVRQLLGELKAIREAQGLSLADLTALTGMDRSALSKLETGQRVNPTIDTLVRYAQAVGKRLVVTLVDQ